MYRRRTRTTNVVIAGIPLEWVDKEIKTLRLRVLPPDGRVRLSVPWGADPAKVTAFVQKNRQWILEGQARIRLLPTPEDPLVDGGRARLWGSWREITVQPGARADARLEGERILLTVPDGVDRADALDTLYRRELERTLPALVEKWVAITGRGPSRFKLRRMKTRWGSCTKQTGAMRLNLALAEHEPAALEYVLVHELAHLHEANHGPAFYALMDRWLPDWKVRRSALRGRTL